MVSTHPTLRGEPFDEEEQNYYDGELSKGRIWIGAGAGVTVLGLTGVGLGVWQLLKAKKLKGELDSTAVLTPVVSPTYQGISLTARF